MPSFRLSRANKIREIVTSLQVHPDDRVVIIRAFDELSEVGLDAVYATIVRMNTIIEMTSGKVTDMIAICDRTLAGLRKK